MVYVYMMYVGYIASMYMIYDIYEYEYIYCDNF